MILHNIFFFMSLFWICFDYYDLILTFYDRDERFMTDKTSARFLARFLFE